MRAPAGLSALVAAILVVQTVAVAQTAARRQAQVNQATPPPCVATPAAFSSGGSVTLPPGMELVTPPAYAQNMTPPPASYQSPPPDTISPNDSGVLAAQAAGNAAAGASPGTAASCIPASPPPASGSCLTALENASSNPAAARQLMPFLYGAMGSVPSLNQVAYELATAQWETAQWTTLTEIGTGAQYNGNKQLGNTQPGDGERYKGRGYVQITGRANYAKFSQILGVNLIANPGLAASPQIAAEILVYGMQNGTFTGRSIGQFINASETDFLDARQVVNGMDQAATIAGYATAFQSVLQSPACKGPS